MTATIIKPGLLTTPQDGGRSGFAHLGVGRAGAFDLPALRIANTLAGNPRDACALEITLLGPTLRFDEEAWIAVTGAPLLPRLDDLEVPMWSPLFVHAGELLALGAMRTGCRAYLAVRGGWDVEPVLGSRSLDVNAALGPFGRALRAGDNVPVGRPVREFPPCTSGSRKWSVNPRHWFRAETPNVLRLMPATHTPLLDDASRETLFSCDFRVGNDSNRTGVRLHGERLALRSPLEMISEGCVAGTLQLPPSGEPIALGVEHPVSGGYPRIGQIAAVDLPRLAQCRPGDAVRFTPFSHADAARALYERERRLRKLESAILLRLHGNA